MRFELHTVNPSRKGTVVVIFLCKQNQQDNLNSLVKHMYKVLEKYIQELQSLSNQTEI